MIFILFQPMHFPKIHFPKMNRVFTGESNTNSIKNIPLAAIWISSGFPGFATGVMLPQRAVNGCCALIIRHPEMYYCLFNCGKSQKSETWEMKIVYTIMQSEKSGIAGSMST